MIETAIVTIVSCLLFAYWFRRACLLILVAKSPRDYAKGVAVANQLTFPEVQTALSTDVTADLRGLKDALDRDFRLLSYLLRYAAAAPPCTEAIERRMLRINYWIMTTWCIASWRISPRTSRRAIQEMALVVAHFASVLGESLARLQSLPNGL